jgi:hypothetical protein
MLISEASFYYIDLINAKSKMLEVNVGITEMMKRVFKEDGLAGFYKGFSASYYSAIISGFIYFYLYKAVKVHLIEHFHPTSEVMLTLTYATSSTIAEVISLILYYPYEMIKVRLMTKNHIYRYFSVGDAFKKILK